MNENFEQKKNEALNKTAVSSSYNHPKCKIFQCNHYLDPIEYDCGYFTKIDCDECKYNNRGGKKDPEAKINIR